MLLTSAHIARLGSLSAYPSTLDVFGHVFDNGSGSDSTLLHAYPGDGIATLIHRDHIKADLIRMAKEGPQVAIGVKQLAYLYFEVSTTGNDPILTVRDLKTATQTDRGLEIRDIVVGDQVIMIVVVDQFDYLESLDAEGTPINQPSVT